MGRPPGKDEDKETEAWAKRQASGGGRSSGPSRHGAAPAPERGEGADKAPSLAMAFWARVRQRGPSPPRAPFRSRLASRLRPPAPARGGRTGGSATRRRLRG